MKKDGNFDRREQRSRRLLREALTALLSERRLQDISVSELTRLADLSRSTFYAHYRDVFDMAASIENELLSDLGDLFRQYPADTFMRDPLPLFSALYHMFSDKAGISRALIGANGDPAFPAKLRALIRENWNREWFVSSIGGCSDALYDYYFEFAVQGCIGLIVTWVRRGHEVDESTMAQITRDFIMGGVFAAH